MTNRKLFLASGGALALSTFLPSAVLADDAAYDLVTPTGTIFGTLSMPAGASSVVLIIAGSGATDRDGNSLPGLRNDAYKLLAQGLAVRGIASVRYDKRAIAASRMAGAVESGLRFDDYVTDAALWIAKLRADGRFKKIAIAGHSEGSLVGMIAAQRAPIDAFISIAGAGRPAADVLREQLVGKLSPEMLAQSNRIIDMLVAGTTADVPPDLNFLFRPSVQPYIISWLKYDPGIEIAKVHSRVIIIQGTSDRQVPQSDGERLAKAAPSATFVLIPGMTHPLKHALEGSTLEQQATTVYIDPTLPVEPLLVKSIADALT